MDPTSRRMTMSSTSEPTDGRQGLHLIPAGDLELRKARPVGTEDDTRRQLIEKILSMEKLLAVYKELARRYRLLLSAVEEAGRVQRSLLPRCFPVIDGFRLANLYRPCDAVGGDFYDFKESPDGAAIIVCDVVGHGLQAGLTTMLLKGVFQEAAEETIEPIALLTEMNNRLHRIFPEGMYAAAAIIKVTHRQPKVSFSNAGLPFPFILRATDGTVDEIALAGSPLGLFSESEGVRYEEIVLNLKDDDVLLVGSDGIGTISGENGEFFEDHRLRQVLNGLVGRDGKRVVEHLMASALAFGNHRSLPDDINLLTVTRKRSNSHHFEEKGGTS
jgi:sigma-B regulation protein RsbU (phosphoserine phosphatase)